ncbi:hypothetical protein [Prosthecobacter dejongeii]|uniref:Uncharacterized protein n=1 Tax=Prosthecobacter dejongeii TaxID=48465 RepID=A0A7W7YQD8_9BACT|nr:hypothetical protein [Prosthecobacter dejongeii]MBB5040297.1 hypothetical protein [Prosthecobacter dejongeii]
MTDPQLDHLLNSAATPPGLSPAFASHVWQEIQARQSLRMSVWKRAIAWLFQPRAVALTGACAVLIVTMWWVQKETPVQQPTAIPETRASLAWMRTTLALSEEEFARECAQHEGQRAECARLCSQLQEARKQLRLAQQTHGPGAATTQTHELHVKSCEQTALQHLKKVATAMNPQAAQAYVRQMLPHLPADHETLQFITSTAGRPD